MPVRVGPSSDVAAGQMRVFTLQGAKVDVSNPDGHLYGCDDTCTHLCCSLAMGELDRQRLRARLVTTPQTVHRITRETWMGSPALSFARGGQVPARGVTAGATRSPRARSLSSP